MITISIWKIYDFCHSLSNSKTISSPGKQKHFPRLFQAAGTLVIKVQMATFVLQFVPVDTFNIIHSNTEVLNLYLSWATTAKDSLKIHVWGSNKHHCPMYFKVDKGPTKDGLCRGADLANKAPVKNPCSTRKEVDGVGLLLNSVLQQISTGYWIQNCYGLTVIDNCTVCTVYCSTSLLKTQFFRQSVLMVPPIFKCTKK